MLRFLINRISRNILICKDAPFVIIIGAFLFSQYEFNGRVFGVCLVGAAAFKTSLLKVQANFIRLLVKCFALHPPPRRKLTTNPL